jgi:hypothetical protein
MSPQQSRDCYCQIFEHLTTNYDHFESKVIVPLDDLVVHSLFGQKTLKNRSRVHAVQKVGQDFEANVELAARIYAAFEEGKFRLDLLAAGGRPFMPITSSIRQFLTLTSSI